MILDVFLEIAHLQYSESSVHDTTCIMRCHGLQQIPFLSEEEKVPQLASYYQTWFCFFCRCSRSFKIRLLSSL